MRWYIVTRRSCMHHACIMLASLATLNNTLESPVPTDVSQLAHVAVNTSLPRVVRVDSANADGTYYPGDFVDITVVFTKPVCIFPGNSAAAIAARASTVAGAISRPIRTLCCRRKSPSMTVSERLASSSASLSKMVTRRFRITSFMMLPHTQATTTRARARVRERGANASNTACVEGAGCETTPQTVRAPPRIVAVHSSRAQAHLTVGVVRRRWMKSRALRLATSAAHAMSAERFEASTAATPTAVQNVAPSRTRTFGGYIRGSTGMVNT